jgi:uncharacterized protein YkwD
MFRTRSERMSAAPARTPLMAGIAAITVLTFLPVAAQADGPVPGALQQPVDALVGPAVPPTAAPAPSVAGIASMPCRGTSRRSSPRAQAAAIRCLVNRARARAGLRPMRGNRALARAATRHARDMGRRHFFSHTNTHGRSPAARARAAGWRGRSIGEALGFGCGTSATPIWIVRSWLQSSSHRAILMSRRYGLMGIGVARKAPTRCGGGKTYALEAGRR